MEETHVRFTCLQTLLPAWGFPFASISLGILYGQLKRPSIVRQTALEISCESSIGVTPILLDTICLKCYTV